LHSKCNKGLGRDYLLIVFMEKYIEIFAFSKYAYIMRSTTESGNERKHCGWQK